MISRAIPGRRCIDSGLTESARLPIDEVRAVRDEIDRRVRALVTEIAVDRFESATSRI